MAKLVPQAQWSLESYSIGLKLRSLRTQKRLTLARLAAETGLSTALLSKLETDRMVPTLPTLATISRVYGVGMSYFFKEATRHTVSITRKAQLQGTERGPEHVRITPLNAPSAETPVDPASAGSPHEPSAPRRAHRLTAQLIEFAPGGTASISDSIRKSCAVLYVLDGRLQLDSGGMQEFLETGDCAYVDTDMTMAWSAAGKHRCRIMAVFPGAEAEAEG
jgi:transcriptional regulator with XRE-family HTH domain